MLFLKPEIYPVYMRRVIRVCFCTLVAAGISAPLTGQSAGRMSRNLLPAPGNAGIRQNLLGVRSERVLITAQEHPLFESSWTGHPDEVVAKTRYGNVSSRDLYLWMILRESPNKAYMFELLKKTKIPKDREALAKALRVEVDEYVFTNFIIPRLMPGAPPDSVYDFKHHVYTLPVWQTVFLQNIVGPAVTITEADRVKYLQEHTPQVVKPERLRARYIFMTSPETSPSEEQDRVEVAMDELRTSILAGATNFADAARAQSQAPSASNGGEIPPFQHGELFFLFENAAANLEPGGISPVFRGPRGFYMVQLIEVLEPQEPSLADPEQAKLVEEGLSRQVLRSAYDIMMRDMLLERRRIVEKTFAWDSLEDCEILGEVCNFQVSKGEFRSAWPDVEGNDLRLRKTVIDKQLRTILEREAMAQDVNDLGHGKDPLLERARWIAGNIIRRDAWIDQLRLDLPISEQLVRNFWDENPDLFTPLALKRVTKLTMTASNAAPLPAQTRIELDQVLARAAGIPEPVVVAQRVELDEERSSLVYDPIERTEEAYQMLTTPPTEPNFYTNDFSTGSLQSLIETAPVEVPSLQGEPAPGLEVIPGPSAITPGSLESLVDTPTTTPILDLPTTAPRGGAAPTPAAGGMGPGGILPVPEPVTPADPQDTLLPQTSETPAAASIVSEDEVTEPVGPPIVSRVRTPVVLPAAKPVGGAVPVSIAAPVISPGLVIEPTPNSTRQLKPPPTSSTPYNPDWFYVRRDGTKVQDIVGQYASTDWLLSLTELGFVYVPDLADAPRKLEEVPVGAFSRPVIVGQTAVSWFIEEARTSEKQSFDEIKTHVYDVYRNVQVDESVSRAYNSELEKANINYQF